MSRRGLFITGTTVGSDVSSLLNAKETDIVIKDAVKDDKGKVVTNAVIRKTTPAQTFLERELGVQLRLQQDEMTLKAINKPEEFMKIREEKVHNLMTNVASHYRNVLQQYYNLGFPDSTANEIAFRSAERMYEEELNILEYALPGGYRNAYTAANAGQVNNRAKYIMATQAPGDLVEEPKKTRKSRKK